ncbi:MAG TPA: hypothetical protein VFO60_12005 [Candidatus Dormibacteraeota bacterium]|nr:hypothetical protein [Candidatus Dormibacteraeota bacterium]
MATGTDPAPDGTAGSEDEDCGVEATDVEAGPVAGGAARDELPAAGARAGGVAWRADPGAGAVDAAGGACAGGAVAGPGVGGDGAGVAAGPLTSKATLTECCGMLEARSTIAVNPTGSLDGTVKASPRRAPDGSVVAEPTGVPSSQAAVTVIVAGSPEPDSVTAVPATPLAGLTASVADSTHAITVMPVAASTANASATESATALRPMRSMTIPIPPPLRRDAAVGVYARCTQSV